MLVEVRGEGRVAEAVVAPVSAAGRLDRLRTRSFAVDAVCAGYGFMPANELARALGCHLPEGAVAGGLADIQERWPGIDIGSYPFYREGKFGTSLVLRGTDAAALDAAYAAVADMVTGLGGVPAPEDG